MGNEVRFMQHRTWPTILLSFCLLCVFRGAPAATNALLGWSETALHEIDGADVSVYSLSLPYSTIHAQLVSGGLLVTNPAGITITYQAVADATGSINSTSQGKGNLYQYAQQLLGQALQPDQGWAGFAMPGTANQPQLMRFDAGQNCFTAQGIPITPYDDQGAKNYFPMMRLMARDSSGNVLATADVVLPVSDELDCRSCHSSGAQLEARPPSGWSWQLDPDRDYKLNVLQSHDDHLLGSANYATVLQQVGYSQAGLVATVVKDNHPVLCVGCHSSEALSATGAPAMRPLTQLIHTKHAYVSDPHSGAYLTTMTNSAACLLCHAGPESRFVRGVHHNTINLDGSFAMQCQSCHGSISAVGTAGRQGWLDEPACQSCHTGTALNNSGALRFTSIFDASGQVRQPADLTFATQTNVPATGLKLFRASQGHGGINCAACHGPGHAEWLSSQPNDNVLSQNLQAPAGGGALASCAVCHPTTPSARTSGPHGMHPVDATWAYGHDQDNRTQCQACHGTDYRGTVLSWAQGNRSFGQISEQFWHGFQVGCYTCHAGPNGGDTGTGNPNTAPNVSNGSATTIAGTPVALSLVGSDPNGDPLSFRIVTQPLHGVVALTADTATYFPAPDFFGNDSFTFAAWDNSTDSPLGTVALSAASGPCLISVATLVPAAAFPNTEVPFRAIASLAQCSATATYDWNFGDGGPHGSSTNAAHTYATAAEYNWTLSTTAAGVTQTNQGVLTISPTLGPPLTLTATSLGFVLNLSWPADAIPTSLETASDLGQPYAWQQDVDPVFFDGVNNNVQIFFPLAQQFFRLRRVP